MDIHTTFQNFFEENYTLTTIAGEARQFFTAVKRICHPWNIESYVYR